MNGYMCVRRESDCWDFLFKWGVLVLGCFLKVVCGEGALRDQDSEHQIFGVSSRCCFSGEFLCLALLKSLLDFSKPFF